MKIRTHKHTVDLASFVRKMRRGLPYVTMAPQSPYVVEGDIPVVYKHQDSPEAFHAVAALQRGSRAIWHKHDPVAHLPLSQRGGSMRYGSGQWETTISVAYLNNPFHNGTYQPKGRIVDGVAMFAAPKTPAAPAFGKEGRPETPEDWETLLESEGLGLIDEDSQLETDPFEFDKYAPKALDGDSPTAVVLASLHLNPRSFRTGAKHRVQYDRWLSAVEPAWQAQQTETKRASAPRSARLERALAKQSKGRKLSIDELGAIRRAARSVEFEPQPYKGDVWTTLDPQQFERAQTLRAQWKALKPSTRAGIWAQYI